MELKNIFLFGKNVYLSIRENKELSLIKIFKNMTIVLKTQTKEIEKGTLKIEKVLEKDSKVPYYRGIFHAKNSVFAQVILKRYSRFSMSYLEERI